MSPFDAVGADTPATLPRNGTGRRGDIRVDLKIIADMVRPGARVLDVGCGDGALLDHLAHHKGVDGRGMELSMDGVRLCVKQGLSVIQGDADTDLKDYPTGAFDYVILSQTLQAMRNPRDALEHLVRIGRRTIVSFPNFGYWRIRLSLLFQGRMPVSERLAYQWWETPNIHFCTIADFVTLCHELGVTVEQSVILGGSGGVTTHQSTGRLANLFGEQGVFLLRRT
ncbi:MAG TPA: methionine biosynthesis protein MetW [Azospirillaceae bacterium]|nr:methionine biosynthesis protein MetW [Azospirillaceae bacterium]